MNFIASRLLFFELRDASESVMILFYALSYWCVTLNGCLSMRFCRLFFISRFFTSIYCFFIISFYFSVCSLENYAKLSTNPLMFSTLHSSLRFSRYCIAALADILPSLFANGVSKICFGTGLVRLLFG